MAGTASWEHIKAVRQVDAVGWVQSLVLWASWKGHKPSSTPWCVQHYLMSCV